MVSISQWKIPSFFPNETNKTEAIETFFLWKTFFHFKSFRKLQISNVFFQNPPPPPPPPPPPQTDGVDFLAHHGSSQYPTPIPHATDFSPIMLPLSSLGLHKSHPLICRTPRWAKVYPGELVIKVVTSEWLTALNFLSLHGKEIQTFILLMYHSADLPLN